MQEHILVVDDETIVTELIERYLQLEGYRVMVAHDGVKALATVHEQVPDLVVLDVMLPAINGFDVCRTIRAQSKTPIIMLSAKQSESDKVLGLGLGADDYVAKPFSPHELVARIAAVLRRSRAAPPGPEDHLRYGSLTINPRHRQVEIGTRPVDLTAKEFDLLHFLARSPSQVFSRDQILDHVWDPYFTGDATTVTVHIRRLREKVEPDPMRPRFIKTVWGAGYKFQPELA